MGLFLWWRWGEVLHLALNNPQDGRDRAKPQRSQHQDKQVEQTVAPNQLVCLKSDRGPPTNWYTWKQDKQVEQNMLDHAAGVTDRCIVVDSHRDAPTYQNNLVERVSFRWRFPQQCKRDSWTWTATSFKSKESKNLNWIFNYRVFMKYCVISKDVRIFRTLVFLCFPSVSVRVHTPGR